MGFYAAMDCLYLIAGNLNLLRKVGNYLPEAVASCPEESLTIWHPNFTFKF